MRKKSALSKLGERTKAPPISWLMGLTLMNPKWISLAAGFTDDESLPVTKTRALIEEVLSSRKPGANALQYGATNGDPELRRLTAARLREQDGARGGANYDAARTIITNGSQQLLYMVTEALCDPGDIVLMEDPTYFVYLGIAQSHGLRCRGIRLEEDGLDLAHLERVLDELKRRGQLPQVKMLYLVSYYQNPTGITTSTAKKAGALELLRRYERAAGHPIYLLEDAAYRELRFAGDDVASALAVKGAAERVIYTGTYSKPFATGVRVGFGVLPEAVLAIVSRIKGNHDFGTANLLQHVLARALTSCQYGQHLGVIQRRYAQKARVMMAALREHFPAPVQWQEPKGGLYIWARLPERMKSRAKSRVFKQAMARDVIYVPGELCYCEDSTRAKPNHEMRLSFGNASEAQIREGIARLGKVISNQ